MYSNPEAFAERFFPGAVLPVPLADGWSVESLHADRVRFGTVNLVLRTPEGKQAVAFIEWRVEGRPALVQTRNLALSYYDPPPGVEVSRLGDVIRALAARFAPLEEGVDPEKLKPIFQRGDLNEQQEISAHAVEIRINRDCNEDCLFCNTPVDSESILEGKEQVLSEMRRYFELGHRAMTLTGREPTLDPNLEGYIRLAKEKGYRFVGLQTNGTTFSNKAVLERLVEAGLDRVQFSLHTLREPTFKVLVGAPRLLEKTLLGLKHAMEIPRLQVEVLCVVTAMNVGELEEVVSTLARQYGDRLRLVISPMAPQGDGAKHPELLARLAAIGPAIGRALGIAREAGIVAQVPRRCGMPLCVTPPEHYGRNLALFAGERETFEEGKAKSPKCDTCAINDRCVGVWKRYLELFGDAELTPLVSVPTATVEAAA
jgi:pyruvate-formate lyase-activating enzyme